MCCAKSLLWCLTHCDPMNCSPQGSSVHGILQARILQWVTMPSSRGSCGPRDRIQVSYVSCIGREFFITAKSLQSCLTLCDPIDGSPPRSPVPGILQAGTLEWVAISFSNIKALRRPKKSSSLSFVSYASQSYLPSLVYRSRTDILQEAPFRSTQIIFDE